MQDKFSRALELQEQGKTRTEIWKILEYRDCNSLTKLMRSRGYEYNQETSKYETVGQQEDSSPLDGQLELRTIIQSGITKEEHTQLQEYIVKLANKYQEIDEMLNWYQEQKGQQTDSRETDVIEVIQQGIQINLPKAVSVKTSIRVNQDIWEQFGAFANRNSEFQKGDLLAQALVEFMSKHRDK